MTETRGFPIAAYLGMLVALALAAAFVATLAIVIFLPPRPPDVMRADIVAEHFQAGYDHMTGIGRPMNETGMVWEVRREPPDTDDSPYMRATQMQLAHALELDGDQVRMAASHVARNETFVFRVRDMEDIVHEAERAAAEAERIADEIEHQQDMFEARTEEARERREAARERLREAAEQRAEIARERAQELAQQRAERARDREIERVARQAEMAARQAEHAASMHDREARVHVGDREVAILDQRGIDVRVDVRAPEAPEPPELPDIPEPQLSVDDLAAMAPIAPPEAPDAPAPPMFAPAPAGVVLISGFEVGAQLPDGRWLVMRQGRNWAEIGWIGRAALIIAGALTVLSILAVLFARRLTRPIRNFSDAVQAVGVDPQSEPVREEGPRELRGAARAVNTMQARLRALIADRTKTLAAVAHDMRTPLMRLRLAAENAPPEQRDRMAKEIGEVEALVASFIAFARDDPAEEARVRIDLSALLQSIADDQCEAGRDVSFEGAERVLVTGQSLGLKRLFANLVENALKYGTSARIKLSSAEGVVVVDVEDDGPGVPAAQRETVFEPFVRLTENGGGAGLGLPAARSIARAHGGEIAILGGERGALLRVTLPA